MRRITFILLLLLSVGYSQNKKLQEINITPDTKLLDGTPVKRCATMEYEEWRRKMHPELGTMEDFERWMQKAIVSFKQKLAAGKVQAVTYTIPVIVHVIHNGEAVGTGYNISAAQIQSQIDRLNEDYQFLNSDTTNIPAVFRPVAADCQIEFCLAQLDPSGNPLPEPGIDRIDRNARGWSAPPYTTTYIDGTIKPATIWDPSLYFNIWVTEITNGILGYATFPPSTSLTGLPSSGTTTTDGVVIGYTYFGDISKVNTTQLQAGAPYNLGRTATHEVGHWLGLRHIWGDANCGDDFCNDTPTADQSHGGCPTHPLDVNACGAGSSPDGEMFMNYMDYVNDDCMNMFTLDQRTRMWTALSESPLRNNLTNSSQSLCSLTPLITFETSSSSQVEATTGGTVDCRGYVDVNIPIRITRDPSSDVTATLNITGGTARQGIDYDVITSSVTFLAGAGAQTDNFVIRVYDEASIENNETITMDFTISNITIADYGLNTTHTLTIVDNDPELHPTTTIFYEDFEAGGAGWTLNARLGTSPTGVNQWIIGTGNPLYGTQSAYVSEDGANNSYNVNDDSDYLLISPQIDATAFSNVNLSFHYLCNGENWNGTLYDYGELWYSTDGTTFTLIDGNNVPANNPFYNKTTDTRYYKDMSALVGNSAFYLAWRWQNDGSFGNNPPFNIDSVYVWSNSNEIPVETVLNSSDTEYLGPGDSAYFVNHSTNQVMAKIINKDNNHDYGCITVTIDRAGTGGVDFQVTGKPATQKTFLITPTTNNPSGVYDIILYYTEAEIAGWEAAASDVRTNLQMFKSGGPISNVTPTNPNANGNTNVYASSTSRKDYYITPDHGWRGSFSTGFSGFALCNGCIGSTPTPITYFNATLQNQKDVLLQWEFADKAPTRFYVQRSLDAKNFQDIGMVLVKDNTKISYNFIDKDVIRLQKPELFYRVYALYDDGSKEYTNIKSVKLPVLLSNSISIYPNPASKSITILTSNEDPTYTIVKIYNSLGQEIKQYSFTTSSLQNATQIDISDLAKGTYLISIISGETVKNIKLIKE